MGEDGILWRHGCKILCRDNVYFPPTHYWRRTASYFLAILTTERQWRIRLIAATGNKETDWTQFAINEHRGYKIVRDNKVPVIIRPTDVSGTSHLKLLILQHAELIGRMFFTNRVSLMVQSAEFILDRQKLSLP